MTEKIYEPKITLGNLLTLFAMGLGGVGMFYAQTTRMALAEQKIEQLADQVSQTRAEREDVKVRVIRIEEKLATQTDKLSEQSQTMKEILRAVQKGSWQPVERPQ